MAAPEVFWKLEINRGSRRTPRWVWIASSSNRFDGEQMMCRTFAGMPVHLVSSDGTARVSVPYGPYAPGEFDREDDD